MSKKKEFDSIEWFKRRYSEERVTSQVLHAIADYLCSTFHFLNVDGRALYVYDEQAGYYPLFCAEYAMRFLEENAESIGMYYALKSRDCKEIVKLLGSKVPETPLEKCRTNSYRVLFSDGAFDVRDKNVHKPSKEDFFFSRIDYPLNLGEKYTPSAETLDFLRRFTGGDPDKESYLGEIIGEILGNFRNKFFYMFVGPPDSGKSTLANMIRGICGDPLCVAMGVKELSMRFNVAELHGKKLVIDSDMDATALNARDISFLKKITGHDLLNGDRKFQQHLYFICQAKLLLCLNGDLNIKSSEDADPLYKRAVVYELKESVPREEQR